MQKGLGSQTLSVNSLRQTVHTHRASVHQAAKLVAAHLRVAGVTVSVAKSNGSLPLSLWLTSPASWLPSTGISSWTIRSVSEYGLPLPLTPITPVAPGEYIITHYRVGQKRLSLRVDNFATVRGRKAYDMSKVSKFCLEKCIKLGHQWNYERYKQMLG